MLFYIRPQFFIARESEFISHKSGTFRLLVAIFLIVSLLLVACSSSSMSLTNYTRIVEIASLQPGNGNNGISPSSEIISDLAWSPDGLTIVTPGPFKSVRLLDARSYDIIFDAFGHEKYVSALAFSPDGNLIASGAWDRTIRIWRAEDGTELHVIQGHEAVICGLAFSPDGSLLASAGSDHNLMLWSTKSYTRLFVLEGHTQPVNAVEFSPDGEFLASGSADGTIRLWWARNGSLAKKADFPPTSGDRWDWISDLAFAPSGEILVSVSLGGHDPGLIHIWSIPDLNLISTIDSNAESIQAVTISHNGSLMVTGSTDNTVRLWSFPDGQPLVVLGEHISEVESVAFSPDDRFLASGSEAGQLIIWGVE